MLRQFLATGLVCLLAAVAFADRIPVRFPEGLVHGFLILRSADGERIADGEMTQELRGNRLHNRLSFKFKDGSYFVETTDYTQRGHFRLLTDRVVQKGPSFKHPMDVSTDVSKGTVTVQYQKDGKDKTLSRRMQLPPDLANGMMFALLKNIPQGSSTTMSYLVATPDPRVVKLHVTGQGREHFSIGDQGYQAIHYVIKIDLGGLAGALAEIFGKQPPDLHIWILPGVAPAFVRFEGPLENGGPPWTVELTSPTWSKKALTSERTSPRNPAKMGK